MNRIDVVGAAIVRDGKILCARRDAARQLGGYWEFPGGKIEPGETPEQALEREIREELGCAIGVDAHLCTSEYAYDFATVRLAVYLCHLEAGKPQPGEHQELRWLEPERLAELTWPPADAEAVALLSDTLN